MNKNNQKKYSLVVIGSGKIAVEVENYSKLTQPATHAGAFQNHPKIDLKGFVDIDKKRLYRTQKYFPGTTLFLSAEKMFQTIKPDVVSVATYPDSHLELIRLAAKYKVKGIVCEKPITETIKDAEEIIRICKKNKIILLVNHMRRFDPLIREWHEKVKAGLIGEIIQGTCYYYNGLLNNGTHSIDLLRFFIGEVDWVMGISNKKTSISKKDGNIDGMIGFKNGARVMVQSLPKNYGFLNFYFYGTKGRFLIKNAGYTIQLCNLVENKNYKDYFELSRPVIEEGKIRSFMAPMAEHLVRCLDGKEKPLNTGEDGLAALKVVESLRKSARNNGKIIKIK